MNNAALVLTIPFLFALTSIVGIPYLLSNLIVIITLMVIRYAASQHLIWGRQRSHRVLGLSQANWV